MIALKICSCVACDASLPMQEATAKKRGRFPEPKSVNAHSLPSGHIGPQMPKGGWHALGPHMTFEGPAVAKTATSRPATARLRGPRYEI